MKLPPGGYEELRQLAIKSKNEIDSMLQSSRNNLTIKVNPEFVVHYVGWFLACCYLFTVQGRVGPFQKLTLQEGNLLPHFDILCYVT